MDFFADPRLERRKGKGPAPVKPVVPSIATPSGSAAVTRPLPSTSSSALAPPSAPRPTVQVKTVITKVIRPPAPPPVSATTLNGRARPVSTGSTNGTSTGVGLGSKRKSDISGRESSTDSLLAPTKKPKPSRLSSAAASSRATASPKPRPKSKPHSSIAKSTTRAPSSPPEDDSSDEESWAGPSKGGTPVGGDRENSMHAVTSAARRSERYIPRPVVFSPPAPVEGSEPYERRWMSSEELVRPNRNAFKTYFQETPSTSTSTAEPEPTWVPTGTEQGADPTVEVEYPGGGRERFPLLVPRINDDEYRPLDDLMRVIRTVLGYFLTAEQCQTHFSETHPISSLASASSQFSFLSAPHPPSQRSSLPPRSSRSPSAVPGLGVPGLAGEESSRATTPLIGETGTPVTGSSPFPTVTSTAEDAPGDEDLSHVPLLQGLARCRRRHDGPGFVQLINWYNRVIVHLRSCNLLAQNIASMAGLRMDVWDVILKQAYERKVGPDVEKLRNYESWSDNVYGELRPTFVSDILHLVGLGPGQVMVDLGSGVGNCVVQAALESGCTAVGFENMAKASELARGQQLEVVERANRLWGVSPGPIDVFEADFTTDPRVGEWLRQADVLLVNNQVFTPKLNEKLSLLFLDLKDGCRIVSLKPFVPADFRLTGRTADSPHAVLDQGPARRYARNSVSWTGEGGTFYIATVDRKRIERYLGGGY